MQDALAVSSLNRKLSHIKDHKQNETSLRGWKVENAGPLILMNKDRVLFVRTQFYLSVLILEVLSSFVQKYEYVSKSIWTMYNVYKDIKSNK